MQMGIYGLAQILVYQNSLQKVIPLEIIMRETAFRAMSSITTHFIRA